MPTPAYMTLSGTRQGAMSPGALSPESVGSLSKADHADEIQIQAFRHSITVPRDPQSGQPSGQRIHDGFTITKIFDKSSPLLYQALATGEQLTEVEIKWFRTSPSGQQEHYFTHTFREALIVDITSHMPNCQDPDNSAFTHLEDITITYKKIEWEHVVASTMGADSWDAPGTSV